MNPEQVSSIVRSVMKIGGTAAVCIGSVDPQIGGVIQAAMLSVGSLATLAGLVWSYFSHTKVVI